MNSSSSNGGAGGGLGARLEARLGEATRRTQALADAVEESLAAADGTPSTSSSSSSIPIHLRSLVAQLLGGQQQQHQHQQQEEAAVGDRQDRERRSTPLLVELRGAGLVEGHWLE